MKKPSLGDIVALEWRDSFAHYGQKEIKDIDEDALWMSVGIVVRITELFVTLSHGICLTGESKGDVDNALSIPWTQVLTIEKVA